MRWLPLLVALVGCDDVRPHSAGCPFIAGTDACPPPPRDIDAAPDSAPCSPIEAEWIQIHPGWDVIQYYENHGQAALEATSAGPQLTFQFSGTGLVMYYEKGPIMGSYRASVDGGTPITIDAHQPNVATFQNPTTIATGLANTSHTASVTCLLAVCSVDYFDVTCH